MRQCLWVWFCPYMAHVLIYGVEGDQIGQVGSGIMILIVVTVDLWDWLRRGGWKGWVETR